MQGSTAGSEGARTAAVAALPVALLRLPAALALGGAASLALAPLHLVLAFPLAVGGLFLLLERTPSRRGAFLLGWLFGLGSFLVGLQWITEAFAVDAERFGVLALPALGGLSALLALFPALSLLAARALAGPRGGLPLALALAAFLAAGEWLRGTALTGFPWNVAGYAWGFSDAALQGASVFGVHGMGLLALLVSVLPALALRRRHAAPLLAALTILAGAWGFGALRLAAGAPDDVPGARLRIVQPSVAQAMKWDEAQRAAILDRLLRLSASPPGGAPPTVVVWPETAVPYLVAEVPEVRAALARVVPHGGALVTGAVRRTADPAGGPGLLNSILVLNGTGEVAAAYDKIRLVPFGEYRPLRALLSHLPKITVGTVDFLPGPPRTAVPLPGLPAAWPLICYEAIFPGALPAGEAPGWILMVTNDAWFGTSWGPYQHLLAARVRAVELGLPLVRAANSGISTVTDALGRERHRLPLLAEGVLDADLPGAVAGGTLYARLGDLPFGLALLLLLLVAASVQRRGA